MVNTADNGSTNRYFAASNSGRGFRSYFQELFFNDKITRRYIIKGGPGTGKSSFIRKVAALAEKNGKSVEYYYCSSDPDSLDGAVIDSSIAVLDGTSPHGYDTVLPGAVDEIINLGEFWNSAELSKHGQKIKVINSRKKKSYDRAYCYLSAALAISDALDLLTERCVNYNKLSGAARRMGERVPCGDGGMIIPAPISAIGMRGRVRFDTLERRASRIYVIEDAFGVGKKYLLALASELLLRGCRLRAAYGTVDTESIEALFVEGSGECFVIGNENDFVGYGDISVINMKRFLDPDRAAQIRKEYRAGEKCLNALISSAEVALTEAGKAHFELEEIYISNMNFDSLSRFSEKFLKKMII